MNTKAMNGKRAESRRRQRAPRRKKRRPRGIRKVLVTLGVGVGVCLGLVGAGLWLWGHAADDPSTSASFARVEVGTTDDIHQTLDTLGALQLVSNPTLALWYQRVWLPLFRVEAGAHWIEQGQSAHAVLTQLGRRRTRTVKRVVLPEGWDSFQIAERFAAAGVCDERAFLDAVHSKSAAPTTSLEGYLYPATYEFRVNTSAEAVVQRLEREARRRFEAVFAQHADALSSLGRRLGLHPAEIVKLASIVEKEAADREEYGLIASVFLNRLTDPAFRPAKMLQSDPTAAYGCKVAPNLESCRSYSGRVTSGMLRDALNPYNTYRYPGLPPTAIGNPSTAALVAVLTAPSTPYYFFVSPSGGRHEFSQTLDEHEGHFRTP